jgi:signal peptidase II
MNAFNPRLAAAILAAIVIVLDQLSKSVLFDYLDTRHTVELAGFVNLVAVWNYGVSFGMFNSGSGAASWIFVGVALAIVGVLVYWLWRGARLLPGAALGLVIGGAIGNVVDRIRYGAVFDFLDFHAFGWHWPAFNVADTAITVGVIVLFLDSLFSGAGESTKES